MEITCKDIRDNRRIRLEVRLEDRVEDLVNKIRAELGEENCYRLVCCGKVMREYDPLVSYCSLTVLPVIVMVTTPQEADKYDQQVRSVFSQTTFFVMLNILSSTLEEEWPILVHSPTNRSVATVPFLNASTRNIL